jgi:hypothetical protein
MPSDDETLEEARAEWYSAGRGSPFELYGYLATIPYRGISPANLISSTLNGRPTSYEVLLYHTISKTPTNLLYSDLATGDRPG